MAVPGRAGAPEFRERRRGPAPDEGSGPRAVRNREIVRLRYQQVGVASNVPAGIPTGRVAAPTKMPHF